MKNIFSPQTPDEGSPHGTGSGGNSAQANPKKGGKSATAIINEAIAASAGHRYGDGSEYGTIRYGSTSAGLAASQDSKVKLDLSKRSDLSALALAQEHITKMTGNPNFTTPVPSAPDFLAAYTAFNDALAACEAAKTAQKEATFLKDQQRANLDYFLTQRGNYVQNASDGDGTVILSSGFDVRSPRTPVGLLSAPTGLYITLNGTPGVLLLEWDSVAHSRSYVIQCSPANTMTREWAPFKTSSVAKLRIEGMSLGQMYAFRIAAVGGSTGQSDWSAEVVRMAA